MAVRLDSAAKHLCDRSGWTLSNLELQKLLYLSQVEHAQRNDGIALIEEGFEAWDYGPIIPHLYLRLKMYGADPVRNVFRSALTIRENSPSFNSLESTWDDFGGAQPGKLIEVTHWERGGWARKYEPGIRSIRITQSDIIREANNRNKYRGEWGRVVAA